MIAAAARRFRPAQFIYDGDDGNSHYFRYRDQEVITMTEHVSGIWLLHMCYTQEKESPVSLEESKAFMVEAGMDFSVDIHQDQTCDRFAPIETHYFMQQLPEEPLAGKDEPFRVVSLREGRGFRFTPENTRALLSLNPDRIRAALGINAHWDAAVIAFAHKMIAKDPFVDTARRQESVQWLHRKKMTVS